MTPDFRVHGGRSPGQRGLDLVGFGAGGTLTGDSLLAPLPLSAESPSKCLKFAQRSKLSLKLGSGLSLE